MVEFAFCERGIGTAQSTEAVVLVIDLLAHPGHVRAEQNPLATSLHVASRVIEARGVGSLFIDVALPRHHWLKSWSPAIFE